MVFLLVLDKQSFGCIVKFIKRKKYELFQKIQRAGRITSSKIAI